MDECGQVAVVDRRTGKLARDRAVGASRGGEKDQGGKYTASGSRSDSFSAYQFGASEDVDWRSFWSIGTDAVMDVPIGGVCEILYGLDQD